MAKYLILFGAGASHGSDSRAVPPLGADLFDSLASFNHDGWGKVDSGIANTFRSDFEKGMVELSEKYPHALPPLQRTMAAYFFNFVPQSTNLYYTLAQKIGAVNWDGALVTLNYERLLELSLSSANVQPYVGALPSGNNRKVELCLPHGCCHIFCEAARGSASAISFAGMNVTINGDLKIIGSTPEFQQRIRNDAFPPVMSYFEPNKQTTSGNNFIQQQRLRFSDLAAHAEAIILIGVRVRENDKHIWEHLGLTNAKLVYISGRSAKEEFEIWKKRVRPNSADVILDGYFRDSFDMILRCIGL